MNSLVPDIEIYVKNSTKEDILGWLNQYFVVPESDLSLGAHTIEQLTPFELQLTSLDGAQSLTLMITPRAAGKAYTSLWFKTRPPWWVSDLACAKSFLQMIDTEVRCASEGWTEAEAEGSEKWWKLTRDSETLVRWL